MPSDYIGGLEEAALLAIQSLQKEAYGAKIHTLMADNGRKLSIGSLYVTLTRLENKGFVRSWLGEATPERGGRAKKYFELTGAGSQALTEAELYRRNIRGFRTQTEGLSWTY